MSQYFYTDEESADANMTESEQTTHEVNLANSQPNLHVQVNTGIPIQENTTANQDNNGRQYTKSATNGNKYLELGYDYYQQHEEDIPPMFTTTE